MHRFIDVYFYVYVYIYIIYNYISCSPALVLPLFPLISLPSSFPPPPLPDLSFFVSLTTQISVYPLD